MKMVHQLLLPCETFTAILVNLRFFVFEPEARTWPADGRRMDRQTGTTCNVAY